MAITLGTRVGPYEVTALIGAGGMGEVWKARDTRLQREVAIKVLPEAHAADPDRLRRFEQEARAIAAVNHPHICQIHDVGPTAAYMSPEQAQGRPVNARSDVFSFGAVLYEVLSGERAFRGNTGARY